ncbi:GntR family transcriptional regulator [Micromonospora sp. NBC_01739]|uniref:GntR family transcriptional regulator n=1 Tax=Micromonospora sp. NBC_01739 TaxID=2975985 RepID=UPI002E0D567E|nr:GntR family transcriptional regulator [Micromonospora sp. NBC_01739]
MGIDQRSHTPVYVQLADLLRNQIEAGELPSGAPLPSESRLSQEYGIGRAAVRRAISVLRTEGLVTTSRGQLTQVRPRPQQRLVEVTPGSTISARMPNSNERRQMGMDEGVPILEVRSPGGAVHTFPGDEVQLACP